MKTNQKGYTLLFTLIMMTAVLAFSAYLFAKVDIYHTFIGSKKYTANTYLAAEAFVISEARRVIDTYNTLNGTQMIEAPKEIKDALMANKEHFSLFYAAKTYLSVTENLFHTPSHDGYFYKKNQVCSKVVFKGDRTENAYVTEVQSRVYPYYVQDANNPLKKLLANYIEIKKAVGQIENRLQKRENIEELEKYFHILRTELLTKPVYEVETIARTMKGLEKFDGQTLYVTIELKKTERQCDYKEDHTTYYFTSPYELEIGYLKAMKNAY